MPKHRPLPVTTLLFSSGRGRLWYIPYQGWGVRYSAEEKRLLRWEDIVRESTYNNDDERDYYYDEY